MWTMILEYQNYHNDVVTHYFPLFNTAPECLFWIDKFWTILQQNGAHDATKAICEFRATASLN